MTRRSRGLGPGRYRSSLSTSLRTSSGSLGSEPPPGSNPDSAPSPPAPAVGSGRAPWSSGASASRGETGPRLGAPEGPVACFWSRASSLPGSSAAQEGGTGGTERRVVLVVLLEQRHGPEHQLPWGRRTHVLGPGQQSARYADGRKKTGLAVKSSMSTRAACDTRADARGCSMSSTHLGAGAGRERSGGALGSAGSAHAAAGAVQAPSGSPDSPPPGTAMRASQYQATAERYASAPHSNATP
eukprot:915279-Rhodomonas_salina.3